MLTGINTHRNLRAVRDGVEFIAVAAGRPDPKTRIALALSMLYWLTDEKAKVIPTSAMHIASGLNYSL